jgi:hypothetical protein
MAQKHMADITELITPLRKQRAEYLKVVSCPVCGKPSHKSVYKNSNIIDYSHFVKDSFVGKHTVCPTMLAPDKGQAAVVKDNLVIAPCG